MPPLRPAPFPGIYHDPADLESPLNLTDLFGTEGPLEVEIGCGNGRFLRRAAPDRPEHLFLGIERSLPYARKAQERMAKNGLHNTRIVLADATAFLTTHFAPESVHTLHVYFTDPWPKARHAKRRLFQDPFLETVHRVLRPGGEILVKVDLVWYFEEIFARFDRSPHFRVTASWSETDTRREVSEVTAFEHKGLAKRGAIYGFVAENG